MTPVRAVRYDGKSSRRTEVVLEFGARDVTVRLPDAQQSYPLDTLKIQPPLAALARVIDFPDGSRCEIRDTEAFDALNLGGVAARHVHRWERHWRFALLALVVTGLVLWGTIRYGVPLAAHTVAMALPAQTEAKLGAEILDQLDRHVFEPSALPVKRQDELRARFADLAKRVGRTDLKFEFRASRALGANAFALLSGTIVFTDAMVRLARHDDELVAVAAHEIGHVVQRHGLRGVLQNSLTALLLIVTMGDISSAGSFVAALPTLLVQLHYSRAFETEADDYALNTMMQVGVPLHRFSDLMERLDRRDDDSSSIPAFFASHPPTPERVKRFKRK